MAVLKHEDANHPRMEGMIIAGESQTRARGVHLRLEHRPPHSTWDRKWVRPSTTIKARFNSNNDIKKIQPKQAQKQEPRPRWLPQLRTPRRNDSQRTERRKFNNDIPLMLVKTDSIATAKPVAHGDVPH